MIRGTTPTIRFNLPVSVQSIDRLIIKFFQDNGQSFEKEMGDFEVDSVNNRLLVKLTQLETGNLTAGKALRIQAKVKMYDGTVYGSKEFKLPVTENAIREVL